MGVIHVEDTNDNNDSDFDVSCISLISRRDFQFLEKLSNFSSFPNKFFLYAFFVGAPVLFLYVSFIASNIHKKKLFEKVFDNISGTSSINAKLKLMRIWKKNIFLRMSITLVTMKSAPYSPFKWA